MQIAVLTFDGFNEIDSFVAAHILNRLKPKGFAAYIKQEYENSKEAAKIAGLKPE